MGQRCFSPSAPGTCISQPGLCGRSPCEEASASQKFFEQVSPLPVCAHIHTQLTRVCVHIGPHVHAYRGASTPMYACTGTCAFLFVHARAHISMCSWAHTCTHMLIQYSHAPARVHIYIQIHIPTAMCICIHPCALRHFGI